MRYRDKLLPEPACAFIRHAFGCFYDAFLQIDLANKPFIPTLVFHETLLSFRSAVLRYAYTIRLLYIKRRNDKRGWRHGKDGRRCCGTSDDGGGGGSDDGGGGSNDGERGEGGGAVVI